MSFINHAPELLELAHATYTVGPHAARQAAAACPFQGRPLCPLRPVCPLRAVCPQSS